MALERISAMSLAALALLILAIMPAASAQAAPSIEEYGLPNGTIVDAMCVDSQGYVWLAQSSPAYLYRLDPASGTFSRHGVPATPNTMFTGMSAVGSAYVWMADQGGQRIIGYDVAKDKFYNFTFPLKLNPSDVIVQDRYMWVACNMELGRIDMETNDLKDYYADRYDASLADLAMDRQGNVWFVEYASGKVGGYYRMDDRVRIYPIPSADSRPTCLDVDSEGRLWFIESGTNVLGRFDPGLESFEEVGLPVLDGVQLYAKRLAVDADDNVWITDTANGRVVKYYAAKGAFAAVRLNGSRYYPTFIEADGNSIWVVESGATSLAKIRADPLYGLDATPTPTPTVEPTMAPDATPTPTPTPGFELAAALMALAVTAKKALR